MRRRGRRPPRAPARSHACRGRRRRVHGRTRVPPPCRASPRDPTSASRQRPRGRHPCRNTAAPRRGTLALAELRRLARLVQAGLLALDLARVAREEALALERDAQLRVRLDKCAGDPVTHGSGLSGETTALDADAEVVLILESGHLEWRDGDRLPHGTGEVL